MIADLYEEFCQKFTTGDIAEDTEKQVLLQYLAKQMSRGKLNGKFIHIPSHYLCELIHKHLGYSMEEPAMYTK